MKRFSQWHKNILLYIKADYKLYLFLFISFLAGSVLAALFAFTLSPLACEELLLYLREFFENINIAGTDSMALFTTGLWQNGKNFIFLFLCSVMVIGAPFILGFASVSGFVHGFTLFFMFRFFGAKAFLFFLLGMVPHYVLQMPCYLLLGVTCLRFSLSLLQDRQAFGKKIIAFLAKFLLYYILAVAAVLMQAYVEPLLIRLVAGLYIA